MLLVIFAGGAWMASGGIVDLMDLMLGMSMGEVRGTFSSDVTDAQKKNLEEAMESLRAGLRNGKVPVANLDPVLQTMRQAIKDRKMNAAEVEALTAAARKANRSAAAR